MRPFQRLVLLVLLAANVGLAVWAAPLVRAWAMPAAATPAPASTGRAAFTPAPASTRPVAPTLPTPWPTPPPAAPAPGLARFAAPVPSPSPSPAPLPEEAGVAGVRGHKQTLSLSCEARAAADWAGFFGVAVDELEFLAALPISDNPERGFVGDVNGVWGGLPPGPYGVHAGPVAAGLRRYGLNAYAHSGLAWDDLRAQIAAGRPVIVWVTGHVARGAPVLYQAADGSQVTVARYEHTVILIGYTAARVTILDGAKTYQRPLEVFLDSWAALGNQAVVRGLLRR